MVGGTEEAFDKVKPLFELMGKNITLVGGNGDGQTTKVANQIIVALTIEAVGRGAAVRLQGRRRSGQGAPGADGRLRLLAHPRGAWRADDQAQLRSRLPHRAAPEGPESRAVRRARAGRVAAQHRHCQELFNACAAHGGKAWDHSGMVRALEIAGNFEIGQKPEQR